jgi:hypothetical protein
MAAGDGAPPGIVLKVVGFPRFARARLAASFVAPGVLERLVLRAGRRPPRPASWRRAALGAAVGWLPAALVSLATSAPVTADWSFAHDVSAAVRLLGIVPLLLVTDRMAGAGVAAAIAGWVRAGVVPPARRNKFLRTVAVARALWGSRRTEWATLALAYLLSAAEAASKAALHPHAWLFSEGRGLVPGLSAAGWWYVLVSAPLFYVVLARWLWRYLLWAALLARLAVLPAQVRPGHPDRVGGLASVALTHHLMLPLALAISLLEGAGCANLLAHGGASIRGLCVPALLLVAASLALFLGPLLVFIPVVARRRRGALLRYGSVASAYVDELDLEITELSQFPSRHVPTRLIAGHATLVESFQAVRRTRPLLLGGAEVALFVLAATVPLALSALVLLPLREIAERVRAMLG